MKDCTKGSVYYFVENRNDMWIIDCGEFAISINTYDTFGKTSYDTPKRYYFKTGNDAGIMTVVYNKDQIFTTLDEAISYIGKNNDYYCSKSVLLELRKR